MPVLTLVQAQALVCDTLVRCGTSPENAQSVANALVACEADGLKGHGLSLLPSYAAQVKVGKVKGDAKPQLSLASPGVLAVDAAHGFGATRRRSRRKCGRGEGPTGSAQPGRRG